ncbi:MAG: PQQ-binding-like beta-propeller repeat protein, partial [Candidatus Hadarchaeales archaeon]
MPNCDHMVVRQKIEITRIKQSRAAIWVAISLTMLEGFMVAGVVAGEALSLQWSYKADLAVSAVAISENGEYIVAGSKTLYFFKRENREPLWTYTFNQSITKICITPDARYIVLAVDDKVYLFDNNGNKLWERYLMQPEQEGELVGTSVEDVAISSDGNYVVAVSSLNINLFSRTGTRLWYAYGSPNFEDIKTVAISGRGEKIVCGDDYSSISLFSTEGARVASKDLGAPIADVEISSDGSKIVAISATQVVLLDSGLNILWSYSLTAGRYIDITPAGTRIVAGDIDSGV